MKFKLIILMCILNIYSFASFAKVGDRFNCLWIDAIEANLLDEKNKYLLFMTGTGMFDNNIDITKWKCTKLSY